MYKFWVTYGIFKNNRESFHIQMEEVWNESMVKCRKNEGERVIEEREKERMRK